MVTKLLILFVLVLAASAISQIQIVSAANTISTSRTFYFASPGSLSSPGTLAYSPPKGNTPSMANLTSAPLSFGLVFGISASMNGQITLSIWINSVGNISSTDSISAFYQYRIVTEPVNNITSSKVYLTRGLAHYNITLPVSLSNFNPPTSVDFGIFANQVRRNSTIIMEWGSTNQPSFVEFPLSGYMTLDQNNPVSIVDGKGNPTQYFPLDASPGNRIVEVRAYVLSALGPGDISRVNMTIQNSAGHAVRQVDMLPFQSNPSSSTFQYVASWQYPLNSTQDTYQVFVDIFDGQGNVAYRYPGPVFGLVPPGFIPPPYNLVPYVAVAGVAAVGGAYYYDRRRKRKSYFVPFEHFNDLTGGGLEGGTVTTIEGNTGSGKSLLSEQLMYEDLRHGRPCVFVATSDFPENIRAKMKTMGLDVSGYEQTGLLKFIDGYSAEAGQESREKVSVPSLSDLTTLGVKISSTLPADSFKEGSLYFDSLSPLAWKTKPDSMVSFVQSVGAKVKGLGGKAFFAIGPGIDYSVQRQLEENADCIVQMEAFEENGSRRRRLKIAKLRARNFQEGWTEFTIEDGKGIIFYSRKPKK